MAQLLVAIVACEMGVCHWARLGPWYGSASCLTSACAMKAPSPLLLRISSIMLTANWQGACPWWGVQSSPLCPWGSMAQVVPGKGSSFQLRKNIAGCSVRVHSLMATTNLIIRLSLSRERQKLFGCYVLSEVRPRSCDTWTALACSQDTWALLLPCVWRRLPHYSELSAAFPSRWPSGDSRWCQPVREGGVRQWARRLSQRSFHHRSGAGALPAASPVKRLAGWIPAATSCQPGWQTNLWKSKYTYQRDFLCHFLHKEGLDGFPESDLYRTETVIINTRSHAHPSDYSRRR